MPPARWRTTRVLRILVADDHAVVRAAIRASLEAGGVEVCAEVADAPAAVDAAMLTKPDVCLLDLHMPGNGLRAAKAIMDELPDASVVMLTVADEDEAVFDAVRAGVAGYLRKDIDLDRLPDAVRGVAKGEAAFSRTMVARILDEFHDRGRSARRSVPGRPSVTLTSREAEVLDLLRDRLTTAQMARRLFVSPATIRTHVASVLRKFGVADRDALLRLHGQRGESSTPD